MEEYNSKQTDVNTFKPVSVWVAQNRMPDSESFVFNVKPIKKIGELFWQPDWTERYAAYMHIDFELLGKGMSKEPIECLIITKKDYNYMQERIRELEDDRNNSQ